jgi:methylmalonyl-CoA mutase, N-terminal domain
MLKCSKWNVISWKRRVLMDEQFRKWQEAAEKARTRDAQFITASGEPVDLLATPLNLKNFDYDRDLGMPGQFPYTRGVHANMYRGRLWTMRQFAGFGSPEDTNQRFKYLLNHGQTGLSVAFDLPTLMAGTPTTRLVRGKWVFAG